MSEREMLELAAKAAGEWWAERLLGAFSEKREQFAGAVARLVEQELRGECYWDWRGVQQQGVGHPNESRQEFDYDPHGLLCAAFAEVWPDAYAGQLAGAMPAKRHLRVTLTELFPKDGYGNWGMPIPVMP